MKRRLLLAYFSAALLISLFIVGCGDTFRPVVNPLPQPGGVPATLKLVAILSNNGTSGYGFLSAIDVSGDTNIGEIQVGHGPSSLAIGIGGQVVYVANQTDSSISQISGFIPNSVTPLTLNESVSNLPAGILCAVPPCPAGNPMVATTNNIYITQADVVGGQGSVVIASIASSPVFTGQLPIGNPTNGSLPVQLVSVPSVNKVYSVNNNTSDLTSWNSQSNAIISASIGVGSGPIKAVANSAGSRFFVANQTGGTVSVVDTSSDKAMNVATTGPASYAVQLDPGAQPSDIFINDTTNQLFVASKGSNSVAVLNVAVPQGTPNPANANPIPAPQFISIPGPGSPVGVVATNDGTRVFCLTVDPSNNPRVYEIGLIGNALPVVSPVAIPAPSPAPSTTPTVASYQFGISSDGTKVYLVYGANSRQTFAGPTIQPWDNVYIISTLNSNVTNTTNNVAEISVPSQTNATPIQIAVQP